jgi:asparagine synthetase B (glutamine-hydrolysing)
MSMCAQSIAQQPWINELSHPVQSNSFQTDPVQSNLMSWRHTQQVADFLGTIHHEFTFTVQEGLDALEDLIWHIESFEQVQC